MKDDKFITGNIQKLKTLCKEFEKDIVSYTDDLSLKSRFNQIFDIVKILDDNLNHENVWQKEYIEKEQKEFGENKFNFQLSDENK